VSWSTRSPDPGDSLAEDPDLLPAPVPDGVIGERDHRGQLPPAGGPMRITCIDYSPDQFEEAEIGDLDDFLARHRPSWSRVRWIDVDGLGRLDAVSSLADKYQLHPLAVEDVIHRRQAPKAEDYPESGDQPGRLFIVARAIEIRAGKLRSDQVSFFLGRSTLLTFHQEHAEDLVPVRQRIRTPASRLRQSDASFLLYVLLDGVVDHYFPVLERYSERLVTADEEVMGNPTQGTLREIHAIKRELLEARRAAWPMRELLGKLQRDQHVCLSETAQTYLRDVHDHCVEIIDLIETYSQLATGIVETYISIVSNRTNDTMKVLTIIGTIFIPLTFLAGVYGMNMPIPENESGWTYPVFWIGCLVIAAGMLLWFRRRRWL
jgi:magnesium transporter